MRQIETTNLLRCEVYTQADALVGVVDDLIVDTATGVVRYANLITTQGRIILLPWAGLSYCAAQRCFKLTAMGEDIYTSAAR